MDKVSAAFYKNVLLLSKFIPPNDDLKKVLKENMFDKPNTAGFIHTSYYLLSIHYKDNLKSKVQWPVICKQTENKFRNDVRKCLITIASDNPDINFPPILASHLLLAHGKKMILIMWKFSTVVLRTFLTQEYQCVLTHAPKLGPCQAITKVFYKNIKTNNQIAASSICNEQEDIEKHKIDYQIKKLEEQNDLKTKIFKMKGDLKTLSSCAPANELAKKEISNVDNNKIIDMWIQCINNNTPTITNICDEIKKIDEILICLCNIVLNVTGNYQKLNANDLVRIEDDSITSLLPPELKVLSYKLYSRENLNLQHFFSLFNVLLQKFQLNLKINFSVDELNKFKIQLQTSNTDIKAAIDMFENLRKHIIDFSLTEIEQNNTLNNSLKNSSNVSEFHKALFMPSPVIELNGNKTQNINCENKNLHHNYLNLTPVEGAYKKLFSRHALKNAIVYSKKKSILPVMRINFDDTTLYDVNSDMQNVNFERKSSKLNTSRNIDKFSALFTFSKRKHTRVNNSSIVSSAENSILPLMNKHHCLSLIDSTHDFNQESLMLKPNFNSTIEPPKIEEKEVEPQKKNKRRSLTDLVARYKKILQERDTNQQNANSSTNELLNEEAVV